MSKRIDIWYGKRQCFGRGGNPPRWANVFGRVYGPVQRLTYSLNGSNFRSLSMGPDQRRLAALGDFNIDLDVDQLRVGDNMLTIQSTSDEGETLSEDMVVEFAPSPAVLPYTVDWREVRHIQDAAQIIDGQWQISADTVSPVEIGYDRLLAIGDMTWRNLEICVPITVHGISATCYAYPSVHAGVGVVMHWKGHSNWGRDAYASGQPYFGPSPYGAIGWYCVFHDTGPELNFFDPDAKRPVRLPRALALHVQYVFKLRTVDDMYALKVWEQGQAEPDAWDLEMRGTPMSLREGSLVLGAHHVAASFGRVLVSAR